MNIKKLSEVLYTDQPSENAHVIVEDGGSLARTDIPSGGGVTPEIMAQIENAQWKSESSEQLFSETVTTTGQEGQFQGLLSYDERITSDTITVTFNGKEYVCNRIETPWKSYVYGGWDEENDEPNFDEFPFFIESASAYNALATQTSGTYTVSASVDAVTYTDEFQKAVKSLSGAVEVENYTKADVAIVYIPEYQAKTVDAVVLNTTNTPTLTTETMTIEFGGIYVLYKIDMQNQTTFSNEYYEFFASMPDVGMQFSAVRSRETFINEVYFIPRVDMDLTGNEVVKYYSLGLPHTIDGGGSGSGGGAI